MIFEDKEIILENADRWLMPNFSSLKIARANAGVVMAQLATQLSTELETEFRDLRDLETVTGSLDVALHYYAGRKEVAYLTRTIMDFHEWEDRAPLYENNRKAR